MKGNNWMSMLLGGMTMLLATAVSAVELPATFPLWNSHGFMLSGINPPTVGMGDRGNMTRQFRCSINGDKENHVVDLVAFNSDGMKLLTLRSKTTVPLSSGSPCDMIWSSSEQLGTGVAIAGASMDRRYVVGRYNTSYPEKFWIFVFDEAGTLLWSKSLVSGEGHIYGTILTQVSGVGDYLNVGDGVDEVRVVSADYGNERRYFRFYDISTGALIKTLDVAGR